MSRPKCLTCVYFKPQQMTAGASSPSLPTYSLSINATLQVILGGSLFSFAFSDYFFRLVKSNQTIATACHAEHL